MILRIDLAPDTSVKSNYREILPLLFFSVLFALAGYGSMILFAQGVQTEAQSMTEETQKKQATLNSLQIDLKHMQETKELSQELERRQSVIGGIAIGRKQPVLLLDKMQEIHLERMWITSLELQSKDEGTPTVVIDGWATDYNVIAEYIRRIKNISNKQDGRSMDAKDFIPKFEENNQSLPQNSANPENQGNNTHTIEIGDIILDDLSKNIADASMNLPIQQFKIRFKPVLNEVAKNNNPK